LTKPFQRNHEKGVKMIIKKEFKTGFWEKIF